jgi:hypothetical protein
MKNSRDDLTKDGDFTHCSYIFFKGQTLARNSEPQDTLYLLTCSSFLALNLRFEIRRCLAGVFFHFGYSFAQALLRIEIGLILARASIPKE